jgi:hypothetical protein
MTTSGQKTGTVKICEADELAKRWTAMIKKPMVPMEGIGGLDMKGTPKWAGLTIDQAQQTLCQAEVIDVDLYYWGDNAEVIAFFDTQTRLIYGMGAFVGYEGKINADNYELGINSPIMKDGKELTDPTSDANIRDMNRVFLKAYRPEVPNPEQRDCVALSTCYVTDWNTMKLFVFLDLGLYIAIEPKAQKIYTVQIYLERNFDFTKGDVKFEAPTMPPAGSLPPTPKIAYSATCQPALGSTWDHITQNCLGIDPVEKALSQPWWSNEAIMVDMGSLSVFLTRQLATDAIFPIGVKPEAKDQIIALSLGGNYEGKLHISRTDLYGAFLADVAAQIKALYPAVDLAPSFAKLKPKEVKAGDAATLSMGTQRITDCTVTPCADATLTIRTRELVEAAVKAAGAVVPESLKNPNFYTEIFLRHFLTTFNDGKTPSPAEVYFYFGDDTAQYLYARLSRKFAGERYIMVVVYRHNNDQILGLTVKKGALRTEDVLFKDAEASSADGVFRLWSLAKSPRLGLAQKLFPDKVLPSIQSAIVTVPLTPAKQVLVGYHKQDTLAGYSIPIDGQHDLFNPSAYFGFSGMAIGAGIYASGKDGIIKSVASGSFYDKLDFCNAKVGLFDPIDAVVKALPTSCDTILSYSENGKLLTMMSTYVQETPYKIGLRLYFTAGRVDSARYWAE